MRMVSAAVNETLETAQAWGYQATSREMCGTSSGWWCSRYGVPVLRGPMQVTLRRNYGAATSQGGDHGMGQVFLRLLREVSEALQRGLFTCRKSDSAG